MTTRGSVKKGKIVFEPCLDLPAMKVSPEVLASRCTNTLCCRYQLLYGQHCALIGCYILLHTLCSSCRLLYCHLAAGRALTVLPQVRVEPFRKFSIDFTCRVIEYVMGVRELTDALSGVLW